MHDVIAGVSGEIHADHINGNSLDNRRENLRPATIAQNNQNIPAINPRSRTGHRGVDWCASIGKYRARVRVGGRVAYQALFTSIDDAIGAVRAARAQLMTHAPESAKPA
jgi:hypothetical protein